MQASDFDYDLPASLIAQRPPAERSGARMLVLDRGAGTWEDALFRDLPDRLGLGDCLVVNDSRVLAARLRGRRRPPAAAGPGGAAELLLLEPVPGTPPRWRALVRPGRKLPEGATVDVGGIEARILDRLGDGIRIVEFPGLDAAGVERLLAERGRVPLPPYIRREADGADRERYQTVFARRGGSVAAPTAGLHFDAAVLEAVRARGVAVAAITLHVGAGTFRPVAVRRVRDHRMHAERFDVSAQACAALRAAQRTIAVGTTAVRAIESAAARTEGPLGPARGKTDLFITPGHRFRATGGLLTNFHLPKSTLLMLVAAFAGTELVLEAYAHAVRKRYRFYSYGDCMLIV